MHTRSKCLLPFIYYKSLAALICSLDLYKNVIHEAGVKRVLALRIILYSSGVCVYGGHTMTHLERAVKYRGEKIESCLLAGYSRYSSLAFKIYVRTDFN